MENGKLKWPRTKDEVRTLTNQQVRWLLEGLSIDQPNPYFLCVSCGIL
nr:IS66 family insertion sequence element accessory protein TnpB [Enterococcus faecium]